MSRLRRLVQRRLACREPTQGVRPEFQSIAGASGCVSYHFDFARDRHIALMAELLATVHFVARADLHRQVQDGLGVRLDP